MTCNCHFQPKLFYDVPLVSSAGEQGFQGMSLNIPYRAMVVYTKLDNVKREKERAAGQFVSSISLLNDSKNLTVTVN